MCHLVYRKTISGRRVGLLLECGYFFREMASFETENRPYSWISVSSDTAQYELYEAAVHAMLDFNVLFVRSFFETNWSDVAHIKAMENADEGAGKWTGYKPVHKGQGFEDYESRLFSKFLAPSKVLRALFPNELRSVTPNTLNSYVGNSINNRRKRMHDGQLRHRYFRPIRDHPQFHEACVNAFCSILSHLKDMYFSKKAATNPEVAEKSVELTVLKEMWESEAQVAPEDVVEAALASMKSAFADAKDQQKDLMVGQEQHIASEESKHSGPSKRQRVEGGDAESEPNSHKQSYGKKTRVAMCVGFIGTDFHGLQWNPPFETIESVLFQALIDTGCISPDNAESPWKSGWQRSARTDKGVHAARLVIVAKLHRMEEENIADVINEKLPSSIRVHAFIRVTKSFHAKNQCDRRIYEYMLPTFALQSDAEYSPPEKPLNSAEGVDAADIPVDVTTTIDPSFRISTESLDEFKALMKRYEGRRNYWMFTSRREPKDPSNERHIFGIECSDAFIVDGVEFISIRLEGQSFVLNQIRKMVALAVTIMRGYVAESDFESYFQTDSPRLPIVMVPGAGLMLDTPVYSAYNIRMEKALTDPRNLKQKSNIPEQPRKIDWSPWKERVEAFKRDVIHPEILRMMKKTNAFDGYLNILALRAKHFDLRSEVVSDTLWQTTIHRYNEANNVSPEAEEA